jgi:hypothetical protein
MLLLEQYVQNRATTKLDRSGGLPIAGKENNNNKNYTTPHPKCSMVANCTEKKFASNRIAGGSENRSLRKPLF